MRAIEQELLYRWATEYLHRSYPRQTGERGQKALRALVVNAISRARGRGYESSDYVLKYVHATFLLDGDLETAPGLAWARQILDNPEVPIPGERLAVLEDAVLDRLEASSGGHQGI